MAESETGMRNKLASGHPGNVTINVALVRSVRKSSRTVKMVDPTDV
jgi:hypothetical protein